MQYEDEKDTIWLALGLFENFDFPLSNQLDFNQMRFASCHVFADTPSSIEKQILDDLELVPRLHGFGTFVPNPCDPDKSKEDMKSWKESEKYVELANK